MSNEILAFDYILKENLYDYSADTWGSDERTQNYESVEDLNGQVNYKDEVFVVTHSKGGGAGMGAYPPSVAILRIKAIDETVEEKVTVIVIESEAGWGERVDDVLEFDTRIEAEAYVADFNKDNDEATTPSWYMYAYIDEDD